MSVPLSYFFSWNQIPDALIPQVAAEFKANGAEYLVLGETWSERMVSDRRFYAQLSRMINSAGMKLFETHAPFGECFDLNTIVPARQKAMIEEQKLIMNYSADLGCKTYTIHIGAYDCVIRHEVTLESMRERGLRALEELAKEAEKLKLIIAVENSFEMSNSPDEVLWLLTRVPSPYVGCCFDIGHANYMAPAADGKPKAYSQYQIRDAWRGKLVEEPNALKKLLPYIVTSHLHDNNGLGDGHDLPGRGTVNWEREMPILKSAPRLVSLQSEVSPVPHRITIRELCATMSRIVAL